MTHSDATGTAQGHDDTAASAAKRLLHWLVVSRAPLPWRDLEAYMSFSGRVGYEERREQLTAAVALLVGKQLAAVSDSGLTATDALWHQIDLAAQERGGWLQWFREEGWMLGASDDEVEGEDEPRLLDDAFNAAPGGPVAIDLPASAIARRRLTHDVGDAGIAAGVGVLAAPLAVLAAAIAPLVVVGAIAFMPYALIRNAIIRSREPRA